MCHPSRLCNSWYCHPPPIPYSKGANRKWLYSFILFNYQPAFKAHHSHNPSATFSNVFHHILILFICHSHASYFWHIKQGQWWASRAWKTKNCQQNKGMIWTAVCKQSATEINVNSINSDSKQLKR